MSNVEADDSPTIPKVEHSRDGSFSSVDSSPEIEADEQASIQENAQVQKRKGGRKPIYATSEERKQRNRQAQAAFRERRTEYIKQLETTIKHQEESLQNLQQSHRSAADECLMLRYKNSLLERILLEKGIDVKAELKTKTDSPNVAQVKASPSLVQPSPVQRAIMNRHHQARLSASGNPPKPISPQTSHLATGSKQSPQLQPTPPSQMTSPSVARSPNFITQGGISPGSGVQAQQQTQQQHQQPQLQSQPLNTIMRANTFPQARPYPGIAIPTSSTNLQPTTPLAAGGQMSSGLGGGGRISAGGSRPNHWPSPYQAHIEQLEQEYSHADMLDDQDPSDHSAGPGPYPESFHHQPFPPGHPPSMGTQAPISMQPPVMLQQPEASGSTAFDGMAPPFDPFDPMLDADPFGLTASMHFPTQFTFHESSMRK